MLDHPRYVLRVPGRDDIECADEAAATRALAYLPMVVQPAVVELVAITPSAERLVTRAWFRPA